MIATLLKPLLAAALLGLFDVSTGVYRPERDLFRDLSHGP